MAIIQGTYLSDALKRSITYHVYLPNDTADEMKTEYYERPAKVLYLLIGYSGASIDWVTGSLIFGAAQKYNVTVVMVSGENSFYLNQKGTGRAYEDFAGRELPEYINKTFHIDTSRENTWIGGVSMGGFGAIHTGLGFPERFGKIIALSSALIIHEIKDQKPGFKNSMADYDYYTSVFGPLGQLEESRNNPEKQIKELLKNGKTIPDLYMACGTEDFLLEENRAFRDFLAEKGVSLCYKESPGIHDWKFWNEYLDKGIRWALEE